MDKLEKIQLVKEWLGYGSINIFGKPFSGKDYQGKILADMLDAKLLGGGEILRSINLPESSIKALSSGKLIPSDDYVNLVLPFLSQRELQNSSLVLSAVGRWHGEELGVLKTLEASGHPLRAVVYLETSDNESFNRWRVRDVFKDRSDRADDTQEILSSRLEEFGQKTIPVIDYYESKNILIRINGEKNREDVTDDILDSLVKIASQ